MTPIYFIQILTVSKPLCYTSVYSGFLLFNNKFSPFIIISIFNHTSTYAVLSVLLSSVYTFQVQNVMNRQIRQGNIAIDFIKPISVLGSYFFQDIGNSVSAFANRLLPLLLVSFLFFGSLKPAGFPAFLLFLLSCTLSYIILWIFSAMVGMTAFWFMALGNVGHVKDAIFRILSGSIVPLWFFPESMQTVSKYLPFMYTYQTPLGIFIGLIKPRQALESMMIQVFWIIFLLFMLNLIWTKAKKSVLVQGG